MHPHLGSRFDLLGKLQFCPNPYSSFDPALRIPLDYFPMHVDCIVAVKTGLIGRKSDLWLDSADCTRRRAAEP